MLIFRQRFFTLPSRSSDQSPDTSALMHIFTFTPLGRGSDEKPPASLLGFSTPGVEVSHMYCEDTGAVLRPLNVRRNGSRNRESLLP